jgi:hypothetical protein
VHKNNLALIFLALPAVGVFNEDLTFGLDGARLANTCISPSFLEDSPMQLCRISNPKRMFASMKIFLKKH